MSERIDTHVFVHKNQLIPLNTIAGFPVRPGFYHTQGATALPGAVNFNVASKNATRVELLLFRREEREPYAVLPFPENYRIGDVYAMIVFGLDIEEFEYAYRVAGPFDPKKGLTFDRTKYLLDPYARAVTGQSRWGVKLDEKTRYHARVVRDDFDWGDFIQPQIPLEDLIIYELHVRGFTKDASSGVAHPGTFAGLLEKLPYLKKLGVNAVELMPIFEFDETRDERVVDGQLLCNYWGYNTVCFFAPNTSYCSEKEYNREGNELKKTIRTLNENGIEVILDVVFNHTAEGNESGPFFSFKGFDNNIYYMLTPDGYYYNFSGCGNTLNCNHPIVQQMILECLRYWAINYRVDGFRFDLASILGRNEDGSPMSKPPLLESLAFDPVLSRVKLIAEAWDAGGLYQVGSFPSWKRWAEWNGKYRDDMRGFLKGDEGMAQAAATRLTGSADLYPEEYRGDNASVNFLTCHDGFTLYDLYSYNEKHNDANGWGGTDGGNDNRSWNCGQEGETDKPDILALRMRMIRNACVALMTSRGTPMFLAGDEFGNTQFGNNNAYCQDNIISWLDWGLLKKNRELFMFFRRMIALRREHEILRKDTTPCSMGWPLVSVHGVQAWKSDFSEEDRVVAVLYAGRRRVDAKGALSAGRCAAGADAVLSGKCPAGADDVSAGKCAAGADAVSSGNCAVGADVVLHEKCTAGADVVLDGKCFAGAGGVLDGKCATGAGAVLDGKCAAGADAVLPDGRCGAEENDLLYVAFNTWWESVVLQLPALPPELRWVLFVDTSCEPCFFDETREESVVHNGTYKLAGRSALVLRALPCALSRVD